MTAIIAIKWPHLKADALISCPVAARRKSSMMPSGQERQRLQVVSAIAAQWGWRDVSSGKVVGCDLQVSGQPAVPAWVPDPRLVLSADPAL